MTHWTPETVPTPLRIPPEGTSSPGYSSWPANGESSRKEVPGSMSAVTRLKTVSRTSGVLNAGSHTLLVAFSLSLRVSDALSPVLLERLCYGGY